VAVRECAPDQLESKGLVEVLESLELRTLSVTQQREVLEGSKIANASRAAGPSGCVDPPGSYQFKLVGEQHEAIFLYDLVDDEHNQLAQCRRRRGRHHSRPRFMQL
jgi:hypothetical protein